MVRGREEEGCGEREGCGEEEEGCGRVGQTFFSKERNVLVFFCVLYKRTFPSLRSFTFFIKECFVLCVLLCSL